MLESFTIAEKDQHLFRVVSAEQAHVGVAELREIAFTDTWF